MKNKLSLLLLSLTLSGLMVSVASAHPSPPPHPGHHGPHHGHYGGFYGPGFVPSLSFVINTDDNDSNNVSMVGHVIRKTGDDTYLFTNGSDTFHLNSDNSDLPIGPTIVIGGRFDDGQVDIRKWHYAE